jgi:hypothetical protein
MFLLQKLNKLCVRVILTFRPKIAKATFLSTRTSDCRGGTGLKTVFLSTWTSDCRGGTGLKTVFLSTWTSDCRGGTGLKTVFVSVCGNLQHI